MTTKKIAREKRDWTANWRLLPGLACLALLAGCGGGGSGSDTATAQDATKQIAAVSGGTVPAGWIGRVPINTAGDIPFDSRYFVTDDNYAEIDKAKGYVSNQFWITSNTLSKDAVYQDISRRGKLKVKAYREGVLGFLVEIDTSDIESVSQLKTLKDNQNYSIFNRVYTGKNSIKNFGYPLSNGLELEAGPENWHFRYINLSRAWDVTKGSSNQLIGVIDNGFYPNHDQLLGKINKNYSAELGEHGTAVLGTIAGAPNANALTSGINWNANFVVGTHRSDQHITIELYEKILNENNAIKVMNNSWGDMPACKSVLDYTFFVEREVIKCPSFEDSLKYTIAFRKIADKYKDVVHVWAAGNNGEDAKAQNGSLHFDDKKKFSPLNNVIVVGAVLKSGELASYSNFGTSVDVAAPTEIKSARNPNDIMYYVDPRGIYGVNRDSISENYDSSAGEFCRKGRNCPFGGTSASAPIVAGVISLMQAVNSNLQPAEIKDILIKTSKISVKTRSYYKGEELKSENLDHPIPVIDAEAAVKEALARKPVAPPTDYSMAIEMSPSGLEQVGGVSAGFGSYSFLSSASSGSNKPAILLQGGAIRIPNRLEMQFTTGMTLTAMVRIDSMMGMTGWGNYTNDGYYAASVFAKSADYNGVAFHVNGYGNAFVGTYDQTWGSGGGCTSQSANFPGIPNGTWFRVTYTASAMGGTAAYVNGALSWLCPFSTPNFSYLNSNDLYIGRFSEGFWYPVPGAVADVKIWKRALSQAEINSLN